MVKVLFVCLGNICRSPTAEGVFRKLVQQEGLEQLIEIDSAGTHAYHVGEPPDARARQAAARRGVDLDLLRGRQVDLSLRSNATRHLDTGIGLYWPGRACPGGRGRRI